MKSNISSAFVFRWLWVAACVTAIAGGCRKKVVSPAAGPWPILQSDPREATAVENWPQFRGPNAQGIGTGRPPITFSEKDAVWKTPLSGSGNSSPVVWKDRIFLTAEEGSRSAPDLYVMAFDRTDGHLLWKVRAAKASGRTHAKNGHASASAAVDGEHVYVCFGSQGLFCYDLDGNFVWHAELGKLEHIYGTAASPILFENSVIQLCDASENSYLVAFEKNSGKLLWRSSRESTGSWTTPVVVPVETDRGTRFECLVNGGEFGRTGRLTAYDARTGKELWYVDGLETLVTPVALYANDLVFSLSGRNGPIIAVEPGGGGNVTKNRVRWRLPRGGPYIPSGIVYRNRLYVVGDQKTITCYNPGDGSTIWSERLGGTFTASLVAADGRLYAANEQGHLFVVEAADTFKLSADNELPGRILATPAIVEGDLIVRTDQALYLFAGSPSRSQETSDEAPQNGESRAGPNPKPVVDSTPDSASRTEPANFDAAGPSSWPLYRGTPSCTGISQANLPARLETVWVHTEEKESFSASPVIAEGTVVVGSVMGALLALDVDTGEVKWRFESEAGFTASAAYHDGAFYVGDVDGVFYCLDAKDGSVRWKFETDGEIDNSANFFGNEVVFGSQDFNLYCLDARTGEKRWAFENEDQIRCCPPIVDHFTLIAGCDGALHVLDLFTGEEVRKVDLEGPTGCTPAVAGNIAYVGTEDGLFFAVDWQEGSIAWRFEAEKAGSLSFRSSAVLADELVIVGARDKSVRAFDRRTGKPRGQFMTRRYVDGSPVRVGDRVYIGSMDGRLYCLDARDTTLQTLLWEKDLGGAVSCSPAVVENRLVVATEEGDIYCFGPSDKPPE